MSDIDELNPEALRPFTYQFNKVFGTHKGEEFTFADIRGWGFLTGACGQQLEEHQAVQVQTIWAASVCSALNQCGDLTNKVADLEATISSLSEQNRALDAAAAELEDTITTLQAERDQLRAAHDACHSYGLDTITLGNAIVDLTAERAALQQQVEEMWTGLTDREGLIEELIGYAKGTREMCGLDPNTDALERVEKAISALSTPPETAQPAPVEPEARTLSRDDVEKGWQYMKQRWCGNPEKAKQIVHFMRRDDLPAVLRAMGFQIGDEQ